MKKRYEIIIASVIFVVTIVVLVVLYHTGSIEDVSQDTSCEETWDDETEAKSNEAVTENGSKQSSSIGNEEETIGDTPEETLKNEVEVDEQKNSTTIETSSLNSTTTKDTSSESAATKNTSSANTTTKKNTSESTTETKVVYEEETTTVKTSTETDTETDQSANWLQRTSYVTVTPENLGVPTALDSKYGSNSFAKNIWDMKVLNGKVFIGSGDYETNTGATPIYYFTNDSTQAHLSTFTNASGAVSSSGLNTEAVERIFEMNGSLYALATDPLGAAAYASYYKYDEGKNTWQEYQTLTNGVHIYDIVEYDGKIFFGGMVRMSGTDTICGCVQVLDKSVFCTDTKAETLVFYCQDGVTPYSTSPAYYNYWRVYDMFIYNNELYAIHHKGGPIVAAGLFKYDKKLNAFVQVYDGTVIRGVIAVANRIMTTTYDNSTGSWEEVICYYRFEDNETVVREKLKIGIESLEGDNHGNLQEKIVVGNTVVLVKNGIYKANGIENFSKVSLGTGCDNYVVRDAFELDGRYYFLASEMKGVDNYITTVFETDSNFSTYRKVITMSTKSFARSFAYNDGYLYIGLGSNQKDSDLGYSQYSGTILRVDLKSVK